MRFPPSFIERLRSHFLMSEVIGKRLPIKKHGREYQALCPFHHEKSPSFTINDDKGFYHCFGCGAHGDAIEFVRRYERLSYPEAIERLCSDAGIPMPSPNEYDQKKAEREKTLYDALEAAAAWFERQLKTADGQLAQDYLEKRGIRPETVAQFRLGYAPSSRNGLHQHLRTLGMPDSLLLEAGLIIAPESGAAYDRFRERVIFPIRDARGRVVAFGGRLLSSSSTQKNLPKYLNSPETELFKKGSMLFNLDQAKKTAREKDMVVVMEGYMDVVSVAQAGITNAVATLGTAVTPEHLKLLWQLAKEPILCLDGDVAGRRAMMRGADVALPLLSPGQSLRFATLPQGEDPDSYVQKHGRDAFEQLALSARRLSQTLWETLSSHYSLDSPESRATLEAELAKLAAKISDSTVRQHYQSYFRRQVWSKAPMVGAKNELRSAEVERTAQGTSQATIDRLARNILHSLLAYPALLQRSQVEETLSHLDIRNAALQRLRADMLAIYHEIDPEHPDALKDALTAKGHKEAIHGIMAQKLSMPFTSTLTLQDALLLWRELVAAYQIALLENELESLKHAMQTGLDEPGLERLRSLQDDLKKARAQRQFSVTPVMEE